MLPESYLRQTVVKLVMPLYPEKAVLNSISGLVRIKIEISSQGEVLRMKVKPGTNPILKQAIADAIKQWEFQAFRGVGDQAMPGIGRLSFSFILGNDDFRVELYNPPRDAPDYARLGYCHSGKELREWQRWEEVQLVK